MKEAAEEHAEEDERIRERAEKLNKADSLVFSTRKQLDEHEDKISDENKEKIEAALEKVKELHDQEKVDELDDAMEELNNAWSEASQEIYQGAAQGQPGGPGAAGAGPGAAAAGAAAGAGAPNGANAEAEQDDEEDAVDADFEVVDDEEDDS